jgi:hypothetical protein
MEFKFTWLGVVVVAFMTHVPTGIALGTIHIDEGQFAPNSSQ